MLATRTIEQWLQEDIGHHDVTNDVPGTATGRLVATESGTVAGLDAARAVFEYLDVDVTTSVSDGATIEPDTCVLTATGPTQAVLRGERVAVNIVGHASGIATRTRRAVEKATAVQPDVTIAATRKTTPGLRGIEKRAVVAGGGDTHRLDLSHLAMIKDNHIAALGLEDAIDRIDSRTSFATQLDVEVEDPTMAKRAAAAGADIVLLDNLPPAEVETAVEAVGDAALTEASGGITLSDVEAYATTGVDIISMGSLTHSAPTLDYSFRIDTA